MIIQNNSKAIAVKPEEQLKGLKENYDKNISKLIEEAPVVNETPVEPTPIVETPVAPETVASNEALFDNVTPEPVTPSAADLIEPVAETPVEPAPVVEEPKEEVSEVQGDINIEAELDETKENLENIMFVTANELARIEKLRAYVNMLDRKTKDNPNPGLPNPGAFTEEVKEEPVVETPSENIFDQGMQM